MTRKNTQLLKLNRKNENVKIAPFNETLSGIVDKIETALAINCCLAHINDNPLPCGATSSKGKIRCIAISVAMNIIPREIWEKEWASEGKNDK